jgi:putative transposase
MRGYNCHEEIKVYRTADRLCFKASRNRRACRGSVPQDGHLGGYVLQLEKEVFRSGNSRTQTAQTARRRKRSIETSRGRSNFGQTDAAGCSQKKALRAKERRRLVKKLIQEYRVSIKRACAVCLLARSLAYYKPHGRDDRVVRQRIKEIALVRVRYGVARIHVLLKREGFKDNFKRVRRIYREEGLNLRLRRPRRNKAAVHRTEQIRLTAANQCWSMDFVSDALFDGRRFRALTVVDNYSRECLEIEVGQSLKAEDVVRVIERIKLTRGAVANRIKVDNGSEFVSKALDKWAVENQVALDFSRPGKPTDNPFIESFNRSFRDECLNVNWFLSIEDAREKTHSYKEEYNNFRPHSALGNLTPIEAIEKQPKTRNSLL